MSYLSRDAEQAKQMAYGVNSHHSNKTYHAGNPEIQRWLRDTLIANDVALRALADVQVKIAKELDAQSSRLADLENYLRHKG